MGERESPKLDQTVKAIVAKIQRFKDRPLGEQNTKASLIEPVLEALGWDVRDPDEVYREFRPTSKDSPVDYALTLLREMKLLVEAKGLGEDLTDRKWVGQILGYAAVAGVEWCVLTDGDEYRFYNVTAPVDADEKLFFRIRLSGEKEEVAVKTLGLISRANLGENYLHQLWNSHYVDRRVKDCMKRMVEGRDKGLIRLIRKRVPKLTPKEIAQSLRRLEFRIDSPALTIEPKATRAVSLRGQRKGRRVPQRSRGETRKVLGQVSLASLIAASVLPVPLRLFRKYKVHSLEATLLPSGKVEFQGKAYDTCSTGAEQARATVTGRKMNTNGWVFWQYMDVAGKKRTLDDARQQLLLRLGQAPG